MIYGDFAKSPEDLKRVEEIIKGFGGLMPSPPYRIIGAVDDTGQLAAFLIVQTAIHAEPLWVREDLRGQVSLTRLRDMVDDIVGKQPGREYYVFAPSDKIEHLATYLGIEDTGYKVMKRKF